MSADERSASDAVEVLYAMARLLRAAPEPMTDDWAEEHATYLEDIAAAVVRDAHLNAATVDANLGFLGFEWDHALIPILFPDADRESVATRAHAAQPRPSDGLRR